MFGERRHRRHRRKGRAVGGRRRRHMRRRGGFIFPLLAGLAGAVLPKLLGGRGHRRVQRGRGRAMIRPIGLPHRMVPLPVMQKGMRRRRGRGILDFIGSIAKGILTNVGTGLARQGISKISDKLSGGRRMHRRRRVMHRRRHGRGILDFLKNIGKKVVKTIGSLFSRGVKKHKVIGHLPPQDYPNLISFNSGQNNPESFGGRRRRRVVRRRGRGVAF